MNGEEKIERLTQQRAFITRFCYWAILALLAYMAVKYLLPVLMPFLIAGAIAWILNKPINFLAHQTKLDRKYICIPIIMLFFLLIGAFFIFFGGTVVGSITEVAVALPPFFKEVVIPFLEVASDRVEVLLEGILPNLANHDSVLLETLSTGIATISTAVVNALTGTAVKVPSLFLKTLITIIVTFFMSVDFETIKVFLVQHIPESKRPLFWEARSFFCGTLIKCLGAYLLILCLTFTEVFLGLIFLKVPYAFMIAILIAIVDILPILGTGSILIPWAVISLIGGDYGLGLGLLLLYLVITIIRNTIEPKLVGKQMGLHPIATFAGMLLGLNYFGFAGMLGVPLLFAFISDLNKKKHTGGAFCQM